MREIPSFVLVVVLTAYCGGCDEQLTQAFADLRAAAPDVCNDYCVEKIDCEWPAVDGEEGNEAYSAAIRGCIFECAWYAEDGAYVSDTATSTALSKTYPQHVGGDTVSTVHKCLYDIGVYRCTPGAPFLFLLDPRTQTDCEAAKGCMVRLEADFKLMWRADKGGVCETMGSQIVEAPYF